MTQWIDHNATSVRHLANGYTLWITERAAGAWTARAICQEVPGYWSTREAAKEAAEKGGRDRVIELMAAFGMAEP